MASEIEVSYNLYDLKIVIESLDWYAKCIMQDSEQWGQGLLDLIDMSNFRQTTQNN